MSLLGKLLGRANPTGREEPLPPSGPVPDQPLFVIGDIHGEVDLLEKMLERIDGAIGLIKLSNPLLVFVGDLVDRGPNSAEVLRRVMELTTEFPTNVISLLGNHEQMLLDFIDAPIARHARWMRNGGVETCQSFGLKVPPEIGDPLIVADALMDAIGDEMLDWMRIRPLMHTSGNITCVHAAVDPGKSLDNQSERVLIWGHPEFLTSNRNDGQWIAHGHTVFDMPSIADHRISVDTGAYVSGTLSCAVILPNGEADFLQVS
jgi:serine/threonine protein phosphatase 1